MIIPRHNISWAQSDPADLHANNFFVAFSGFVTVIFGLFSMGYSPFVFTLIPLVFFLIFTALWVTNASWGLDSAERHVWGKYLSIDADIRKSVGLTAKDIKDCPGGAEWEELKKRIYNLCDLSQEKRLASIKTRQNPLINALDDAITVQRELVKEAKELV